MNSQPGHLTANVLLDHGGIPVLPRSRERLRLQFYAGLMLADAACLLIGFLFANALRAHDPLGETGLTLATLLIPIYLAIAMNSRAFAVDVVLDAARGAKRATVALGMACAAILLVGFYLKASADFSRVVFGVGAATGSLLLLLTRRASIRTARALFGASPLTEVLIVDGVTAAPPRGCFVIDARAAGLWPSIDDPVLLHRLGTMLKHADRVLVACPAGRREGWAMALKGANVAGEVLLPELDHLGTLGIGSFAGSRTMRVSVGPLTLYERFMKRGLDIAVVVALLPVILPVMAVVGLAVKLDSRGPVRFRQPRIGRGNCQFDMLKSRSMRGGDKWGRRSTDRHDDRVTRVGRFIRRTSLDELPQLLNVLRGDMSIVGPRPHAVLSTAGTALFWEVDARYRLRHTMKPGMTGLAQVRGFRGATDRREDLVNRLQADLEYLNGWTIWRDIGILFVTVGVLAHRNAY